MTTYRTTLAVFFTTVLAANIMALAALGEPAKATPPGTAGAIAFSSDRDAGFNIYRMNADGYGQTRLTDTPVLNFSPSWSPDGNKILFTNNANYGAPGEVWAMNADGSGETNLTNVGSDDGEDLYMMRLAPEGPKNVPVKLTKNTPPNPGEAPYMYDFTPDWSPDGTQIIFASDRSGGFEVYRMKAAPEGANNRPVNLSKSPDSTDNDPAFSPDGKKVAFTTDRDGNSEVYRMRATDGANPTNLSNNPATDFLPAWQPLP